jgi:KDO2-lipid IV(A) lauroyltransferase
VTSSPGRPSGFYRAELWRLGLFAARHLPSAFSIFIGRGLARAYFGLNRRRRGIVVRNLLPAADGDGARAAALGGELFANFGAKVADLFRFESGLPVDDLVTPGAGWEHFQAAQAGGRGVLLLTPHLGNWEFGAPLLASRGVPLLVITLVEPDARLTELRRASRARWGIETLVIGEDPFAFVEVIRRLERGATVALLMDRPPASGAVEVELFGKPFAASISAAELARATGCALLPVYLPREGASYRAHLLPEIPYERRALGSRPARIHLTREIMRAFEPVIRQHASQWYHFVPIWPG